MKSPTQTVMVIASAVFAIVVLSAQQGARPAAGADPAPQGGRGATPPGQGED